MTIDTLCGLQGWRKKPSPSAAELAGPALPLSCKLLVRSIDKKQSVTVVLFDLFFCQQFKKGLVNRWRSIAIVAIVSTVFPLLNMTDSVFSIILDMRKILKRSVSKNMCMAITSLILLEKSL